MNTAEAIAFLVILAALLIRTTTGFGSALISIPFLSILFGVKFAVPFILLYECLIDLMILAKDRSGLARDAFSALHLIIAGIIGIPIGAEVLIYSSESLLRGMMSMALIIFSLLLLGNIKLGVRDEKAGFVIAGLIGGFLCGSIGMPGPPMAIFLTGQGFAKGSFRRFMVLFLTIIDIFTFIYFLVKGLITADMLLLSLKLSPALLMGFLLGSYVFEKLDDIYFKKLVLTITLFAGISLILSII